MGFDKPPRGSVYSTATGSTCPRCGRQSRACRCAKPSVSRAAADGVVRVSRETQGRRGKGVTVVTGLPLDDGELARVAKELKRLCGSGGTGKNGRIEIQGDHRDTIVAKLEGDGYTVKRVGG